jgi:hypothetical protein
LEEGIIERGAINLDRLKNIDTNREIAHV